MRTLITTLTALTTAMPATAALPPEYQRAAELEAVIYAATGAFGGVPVNSIEYVDVDLYRATSETCIVEVSIVDEARDEEDEPFLGPRQFEAVAGDPDCGQ